MVFKVFCLKKIIFPKSLTQLSDLFRWKNKKEDWGKGGCPHISFFSSSPWSATSTRAALRWNVLKSSQKIFAEGLSFHLLPAEVSLRCEVGWKWRAEWNQKQALLQRIQHQTSSCSLHLGPLKQTSENSVYYWTCDLDVKRAFVCVHVRALLATWSGQLLHIWAFKILVYILYFIPEAWISSGL